MAVLKLCVIDGDCDWRGVGGTFARDDCRRHYQGGRRRAAERYLEEDEEHEVGSVDRKNTVFEVD